MIILNRIKGYLVTGAICMALGAIASSLVSGYKPNQNLSMASAAIAPKPPESKENLVRADLIGKLKICLWLSGQDLPSNIDNRTTKQINDDLYHCEFMRS